MGARGTIFFTRKAKQTHSSSPPCLTCNLLFPPSAIHTASAPGRTELQYFLLRKVTKCGGREGIHHYLSLAEEFKKEAAAAAASRGRKKKVLSLSNPSSHQSPISKRHLIFLGKEKGVYDEASVPDPSPPGPPGPVESPPSPPPPATPGVPPPSALAPPPPNLFRKSLPLRKDLRMVAHYTPRNTNGALRPLERRRVVRRDARSDMP